MRRSYVHGLLSHRHELSNVALIVLSGGALAEANLRFVAVLAWYAVAYAAVLVVFGIVSRSLSRWGAPGAPAVVRTLNPGQELR